MPKRTRENSPDNLDKIEVPSSTLPPGNRTSESGRFRMRTYLDKTELTPDELRNPEFGGIILNNLIEWEIISPEIQREIMAHLLDFIARKPIPPDEEIIAEIKRSSARADTTIRVRNILNHHDQLPRIIKTAIMSHLEEELKSNPDLSQSETLERTQRMVNEAVWKIRGEAPKKGKNMAGRYCIIAGEIIGNLEQKKKRIKKLVPLPVNACADDDPPTSPGTPNALRRLK